MEKAFLDAFVDELQRLQKEAGWWKAIPFLTKAKWGLGLGIPAVGLAGAHAVSRGAAKGRREAELQASQHRGY